jgi:hypothetical protein
MQEFCISILMCTTGKCVENVLNIFAAVKCDLYVYFIVVRSNNRLTSGLFSIDS